MRITNIQKQQLSTIFRDCGLNVLDFETTGLHKEFKVKYKYEYYSFSINILKPDNYYLTVFPVDNTKGFSVGSTWENTIMRFTEWSKQIFAELNTPTGWDTFQSENFLNADFSELDIEFTEIEKSQIRHSINELRQKINSLELPIASLNAIEKKLNELSEKVDKLSKFDWKSLFIGTFANLIMTLSLSPEINGMIWEYIKIAFNGLKLKG